MDSKIPFTHYISYNKISLEILKFFQHIKSRVEKQYHF